MGEVGEVPQPSKVETRPKTEQLSTEAVLAKLKPRQVEAEEGSRHTIYTFRNKKGKPVEILFYTPNELPTVESEVNGKFVVMNGDDPRWRKNEEWEDFCLKTIKASANSESRQHDYVSQVEEAVASGKGMLFVEANPGPLLEVADQLGIELDDSLREALAVIKEKKLDEASLGVLDTVLAGNLVDDENNFRTQHQHEGEALYLLSLKGDENAQQLLAKKRETVQKSDEKRRMERKEKFAEQRKKDEESGREALELKDLVTVHATRYLPQEEKEELEIPTTFEATDWQIPMNTIHFALNHEVAPHMYGSWEGVPYVVISPLDKMIEVNGNPTVLNTIDTFWEIGPCRRLKLPENTAVVQPGDLPKEEVISGVETNDIRYKASDLAPEDIATLSKDLSKRARDKLNSNLVGIIVDNFSEHPSEKQIELPKRQVESLVEVTGFPENRLNILTDLQEYRLGEVVGNILSMAEIEISDEQKETIVQKLERRIVAIIKRVAVEKKIMQMGYDVKPGGMWAWGGSWKVTLQTVALGAKLEVPVIAHTHHVSSKVTDQAIKGLGALLDTERNPEAKERMKAYREVKQYIRKEYMPKITQDTRRMLYLTGAI